jgi:protein-tyrosine-phosphatase
MAQFLGQTFDYVITVCDRVRENCPTFPDDPRAIHWSLPDPIGIEDDDQRWRAFRQIQRELYTRMHYLLSLRHPATGRRLRIRPVVQQPGATELGGQ